MNPLTNTRNITKLSERELKFNDGKTSWHDEYRESAWIFIGGLPYDLTEGDVIAVFSQYGEIVNLNLCRDKVTGKQKGFAFLCYEDQRSTILAVDNFNGIKILGRIIRVDHVKDYKAPKDSDKLDDITRKLMADGCAPNVPVPGLPSDNTDPPQEDFLEYSPPPRLAIKDEPSKPFDDKSLLKVEPKSSDESQPDRRKQKSKKSKSKKKKSKSKKEKKSKRKHKKRSTVSESDSETSSSDSEDSDDERRRKRRRK